MSLTKASYSMITGAPVNILDYGADPTGTLDSTAAFNLAIATGKKVIVPLPSVGYLVNGITVVDNMVIEGEKDGISLGPLLIVSANNGCAFLQGATNNFHVNISNLACRANTGITGARFFKQTDKSKYSAYTRFSNIETYKDLAVSYDGLFIFATWDKCRDGYVPSIGSFNHTAIRSQAATFPQTNTTNINLVRDTQFFGSAGGDGAVEVSFGSLFTFENCDFEQLSTPAFSGKAAHQVTFSNCWFEGINSTQVITLAEWPGTASGSEAMFNNCIFFCDSATLTYMSTTDAYSYVGYRDCSFNIVPSAVRLSNNGLAIRVNDNNTVGGAGAGTLMLGMHRDFSLAGVKLLNGAIDNSSGATIQNLGTVSATGFTSTYNTTVTTSYVTIATAPFNGGLCFINGYNLSGGASAAWLVMFVGAGAVVISASDPTGTTPTFQKSGNDLQMKTTTGSLSINTSLLI